MLDNGYSLCRVELLNWGNFHGYQKFSLYEPGDGGPLLAPAPASAILGVNGSGKSTLIDALMIVLLPFEGSLKLGVTNDVEGGGGGGRTIRDYVLGKHSSHSGTMTDPSAVFGRKEGCSMILLNFAHNGNPARRVALGRAWWYQNFKVSDTQLAFMAYRDLTLADLCHEGKTPTTAKAFRQNLKSSPLSIQPFETMSSFFTAASQAMGRVSRDDFKILNRAFFVKSITNIDQFIRENMLIEQESPNLDRLMENVRSGQEIAHSIDTCEAKISAIGRILRELNKLAEFNRSAREAERRMKLLSLHHEWSEWRDLLKQRDQLVLEIGELEQRLPLTKSQAENAEQEWRLAQAQLLGDNVEMRLISINVELNSLRENIARKRATRERWFARAKDLGLKIPTEPKKWKSFVAGIYKEVERVRETCQSLGVEVEALREKRYASEAQARDRREELDHVARSGSLIPRELHVIRDAAAHALKIPQGHLVFVGELLQVRKENRELKVAVEAVLLPISRNLLCHPNNLQALTRWLDDEGLRADITVKRIQADELLDDQVERTESSGGGILQALEMRPASEHPFTSYLWRWLYDTFDYELVDVKRFKAEQGKLVTLNGLVKKDQRTMRKSKRDFNFSLGWDNAERMAQLSQELVGLQESISALKERLTALTEDQVQHEDRIRLLTEIAERSLEVEGAEEEILREHELEEEHKLLLERNPDHGRLRLQVQGLEERAKGLARGLLTQEKDLSSKQDLSRKVLGLIPHKESELKNSKLYISLREEMSGESGLEDALTEVQGDLERRSLSRLQMQSEIADQAKAAEDGRNRSISTATMQLGNYRHVFNDPNLPYDGVGDRLEQFLREWAAAEKRLKETDLPSAQEKWRGFFDRVLLESVKDMINEIKSRIHDTTETVRSINEVLKLTDFENLGADRRYLRIDAQTSPDERIRKFRKQMVDVEKTLSPAMRAHIEANSQEIMNVLSAFVEEFQNDPGYRQFVTDVRNHFQFSVQSLRRAIETGADEIVEIFAGARKDAKSSAQTTQLAYALLASSLAYRFKFHDPVGGAETPRLIVFDEFGGKFDNEKPREIVKLLEQMGFQSVLVSPMSKADLLADKISHLVLVHKISASHSKVQSYRLNSREDYERLLASSQNATTESTCV